MDAGEVAAASRRAVASALVSAAGEPAVFSACARLGDTFTAYMLGALRFASVLWRTVSCKRLFRVGPVHHRRQQPQPQQRRCQAGVVIDCGLRRQHLAIFACQCQQVLATNSRGKFKPSPGSLALRGRLLH